MILDYAYNKGLRKLSISYVTETGQKALLNHNVDRFKSWQENPNGEYMNWNGKPCEIRWEDNPDKFDIKTYIEEMPQSEKTILAGKVAPKLYTWDIEVVSDEFPEPGDAKYPVVTISVCSPDCNVVILGTRELGNGGEEYLSTNFSKYISKLDYYKKLNLPEPKIIYKKFDRERDMILYFLQNIVANVPVIAGWNSMLFDWQYIQNRCRILDIDLKCCSTNGMLEYKNYTDMADKKVKLAIPKHTVMLDMMDVIGTHDYVVMPIKESMSLDYIASESLGVNKIQYEGTLSDLYYGDYKKYVFYNAIDSVLVQLIDKRFKTLQNIYTQALYCRERIGLSFSKIAVTEALIFNYFYDNGLKVVPNRNKDVERGTLLGAYVRVPTPGKHKYVCCNDFASLYPSTIITCNLSFENFMGSDFTPDEIDRFKEDSNYFVSVTGQVYKNDKDYAFKVIQSTLKSNRNTSKYLAKGLEAEVVSDIDTILKGDITPRIRRYSEDKIKAMKEIGYEVANTKDLYNIEDLNVFKAKLRTEIEFYTSYEQAMKLLGNSMYGGSSHVSCFWYNMALANDITGEARNIIHLMENHIPQYIRENWPYMKDVHKELGITVDIENAEKLLQNTGAKSFVDVIYGDTDSLYISYENFVKTIDGYENMSAAERGRIVVEFNTKYLDAHNREIMDEHYKGRFVKSVQNFELETLALAGVWLDVKKRYAQVLLWKDGRTYDPSEVLPMKAKGLELIKASYPKQAREALKRLVRQLLEDDDEQYLIHKLNASMQAEKRAYYEADIDDICGSVKVNNYHKYITCDNDPMGLHVSDKCPYNARALGNYNRLRQVNKLPGDPIYGGKLKWFVYRPSGIVKKNNLDYFAYPMKNYPKWADKYAPIAKDAMFQKQLLDPFNRIIEAIGIGNLKLDGAVQMNMLF